MKPILAVIGGCLLQLIACGTGMLIPWKTLADITPEQILDSGSATCDEGPVLAMALKVPVRGYWMLWLSQTAWIAASFGPEEPTPGTQAKEAHYGLLTQDGDMITLQYDKTELITGSVDERKHKFCSWLYPERA